MPIRRALITALLPLLAATAAQAQQGASNVETQRFQDWEVECPTGAGQQGCIMSQMVNNPDSNEPLMRAMVGYPPQAQGNAVIAFMLPLGVNLAPGMQLQVDNNEPVGFPYQFCHEQGCRADLPLEPSMLQQLRSGNSATVSAIAPDGQRLDLNLSLMGFTSASQEITP
ncbi:invasion associated locus B family protein [Halomonas aquamarina]|uniref:Invasion associated locus B family protein n=1 Tax=Vreelandella aquamarina TaxID=77097 RepID=A0ACC5VW07_9GAMM|nr:invasion associated locus B family protein [Halomonas aquamarina]MBZ5488040.1 invasion associated locus B family protein [Halomonas aquamarina]